MLLVPMLSVSPPSTGRLTTPEYEALADRAVEELPGGTPYMPKTNNAPNNALGESD